MRVTTKKRYTFGKFLRHFRVIHNHPTTKGRWLSAMCRTFTWLFAWKILGLKKLIFPYLENSELIAASNTISCAAAYICSLYEYEDMSFLLHFLREDDLVFDVGANIGWYTILAAKERHCNVVSFEPIPKTFSNLKINVALNNVEHRVFLQNQGVSAEKGTLAFTNDRDVENRAAISTDESVIEVDVTTLDIHAAERCPIVIKIDVEGFETNVLKGAGTLLRSKELKAILIELAGHGQKYGFDEITIRQNLEELGFQAVRYDPRKRKITRAKGERMQNTLFIRDTEFVETRVKSGKAYSLFGKKI